MASTNSITVTLPQLAKMIDHSLLHPIMTDTDILNGLKIAKEGHVATSCIKPYIIPMVKKVLEDSDVLICPVIGFPHGNSATEIKVLEARDHGLFHERKGSHISILKGSFDRWTKPADDKHD